MTRHVPVKTLQEMVRTMRAAIMGSDLEGVHSLLAKGFDLSMDIGVDWNGGQALHQAAKSAEFNMCKLLLAHGSDANARTDIGLTPLQMICRSNAHNEKRVRVSELLLQNGANPNVISPVEHKTPLHDVLHESYDSFGKPLDGMPIVKLLVRYGADPSFMPGTVGPHMRNYLTPFQWAVKYGKMEQVRFFLDECKVNPDQTTVSGRSLVQLCGSKKVEIKSAILSAKTAWAIAASGAPDAPADEGEKRRQRSGMSPL